MEKEYRISTWTQFLYGFIGIAMFIFSIYLFATYNSQISIAVLLFPFIMIFGSVLIFVNLARRSVIINNDRIICVSLFSRKELAFDEIKGCHVGEKIIYIEPIFADKPAIRIGNYIDFKDSDQLAKWCTGHFKDLDAIDLENERKQALSDPFLE